jgi:hypothetical protein
MDSGVDPIPVNMTQRAHLSDPVLERPFHFAVVLWGERFRNYFLEYCLPSLLSPGNIPALATRAPSKFLIATRPEDWAAMRATAIFKRLEAYIDPVYLEIPPCPPGRTGCEHMGIGHKLACELSFREKAYAVHATPDCMFSDGAVARMQALAREGKELVLCAALRFGEEPFFANLQSRGLLPAEHRRDSGQPLTLPARDLAWAAVNGLHTETLGYEWDAPYFVLMPAAAWWRVPSEDGIVLHCLSWAPLLLDFAAVAELDTSMLDYWTIDGDFLHRNMGASKSIAVIDDSDEAFLASWAPMAEKLETIKPTRLFENNTVRELVHAAQLRRTYYGPYIDQLKRRLFLHTVRWHGRPLSEAWLPVERKARQTLGAYIDEARAPSEANSAGWSLLVALTAAALAIGEPLIHAWFYRGAVRRRLAQMLRGDPDAIRRGLWHLERVVRQLLGRPFNKPAPRPPA